ncbi:gag-pol polyprotein [Ceratocystis lukuohia]|uniref:Gag-pol polyprotein n=1 Tax=Ceratocystis lukuohia TaxID=2019550 RepID=A0ABR4ML12_9PEZI
MLPAAPVETDDGGDGGDTGDGQPDAFHIKYEDEMEGIFIPGLRRTGSYPEEYFRQAVAAAARWKTRPFTIGDKIYSRETTVRMFFPALSSYNEVPPNNSFDRTRATVANISGFEKFASISDPGLTWKLMNHQDTCIRNSIPTEYWAYYLTHFLTNDFAMLARQIKTQTPWHLAVWGVLTCAVGLQPYVNKKVDAWYGISSGIPKGRSYVEHLWYIAKRAKESTFATRTPTSTLLEMAAVIENLHSSASNDVFKDVGKWKICVLADGVCVASEDERPRRETSNGGHVLFGGWIYTPNKDPDKPLRRIAARIFPDSGATPCTISESCARRIGATLHPVEKPHRFKGFNKHKGPMVTHNATFDLALVFKDKSKSLPRTLTAAVIPDGAIPGDVTLGLSLHSKWEIQYCDNYEVKLGGSFKEERGEKELSLMKPKKLGCSAVTADDDEPIPKGDKSLPVLTAEQLSNVDKMRKMPKGMNVRICIDYRALNSVTIKDSHPLPNMDDALNKAAQHKIFCVIDLKEEFYQIAMSEEDMEKTAFLTPFGLYEFMVMPFGLTNAPDTFQRMIDELMSEHQAYTCGLIDDICIMADTREELEERTRAVLKTLADANLVLNVDKCVWFAEEVKLLGRII